MRTRVQSFFLLLSVFLASSASAQGTLVPTFGTGGVLTLGFGESTTVSIIRIEPFDRMVLAGNALSDGAWRPWLARGSVGGRIDTRFGGGMIAVPYEPSTARFSQPVLDLAVASSRYYVAVNDGQSVTIWAYLRDGRLDPSFTDGRGVLGRSVLLSAHELAPSVALLVTPTRIYVGTGGRPATGGNRDFIVSAIKTDGRAEPSFGADGTAYFRMFLGSATAHRVTALRALSDGRVMIAGRVHKSTAEPADLALGRLKPNGRLDETFGLAGLVRDQQPTDDYGARSMLVFADGRIQVPFTRFDWPLPPGAGVTTLERSVVGIAQYLADGSPDPAFGVDGRSELPLDEHAIAGHSTLDASGRILLTANTCSLDGERCSAVLARMTPTGILDEGFAEHGIAMLDLRGYDYFTTLVVHYSGHVIVGGGTFVGGALDSTPGNTSLGLLASYQARD